MVRQWGVRGCGTRGKKRGFRGKPRAGSALKILLANAKAVRIYSSFLAMFCKPSQHCLNFHELVREFELRARWYSTA